MIVKPDYTFENIYEIDFEQLKKDGIKALLFDLDSTVMPSKSGVFPIEVLELFEKLKQDFYLAIVSNNNKENYMNKARAQVDFTVLSNAKKPDKTVILNCLKSSQIEPKNAAMIGDRPLTDILAGQFAGTKTVLVDSITKNSEAKIVRFARFLERLTVRK